MTLQEQVRAAIEQEAREKYPEDIRRIFEERDYEGWDHDFNGEARAAYVECKMSMLSEIEKAWDASEKAANDCKEWDSWREMYFLNEDDFAAAKAEYIDNLFK